MMRIAYIASEPAPKVKKQSKREFIHEQALIAQAQHRQLAREKAKAMFPELRQEIADLKKKLEQITLTKNNKNLLK